MRSRTGLILLAITALLVALGAGRVGRQRIARYWARLLGREAIVISLSYEAEQATVTRVGNERIRSDEDMMLRLRSCSRVVIAAKPEVPWQDVVRLMDICGRAGLEDLRFEH